MKTISGVVFYSTFLASSTPRRGPKWLTSSFIFKDRYAVSQQMIRKGKFLIEGAFISI